MNLSLIIPIVAGYVSANSAIAILFVLNLLIGAIIGAIPAICGIIKKRYGLAISGFIACTGIFCICSTFSFVIGIILSLLVCIPFMLLIFLLPKSK